MNTLNYSTQTTALVLVDVLNDFLARGESAAEPELPWDDAYRLTGAERAAVLSSIQQFQLGEGAQGRRLLDRARTAVRQLQDAEYLEVLRLFIGEEQRHSQILARFLAVEGAFVGSLWGGWPQGWPHDDACLRPALPRERRNPRVSRGFVECRRRDSNPRHADYDSAALTD